MRGPALLFQPLYIQHQVVMLILALLGTDMVEHCFTQVTTQLMVTNLPKQAEQFLHILQELKPTLLLEIQ